MKTRLVICTNDYPHQVLPENWTLENADKLAKALNKRDEERCRKYNTQRIYYRVHEVEESGEFKPWDYR